MKKATLAQLARFMHKVDSGEIDREALQAILEGRYQIGNTALSPSVRMSAGLAPPPYNHVGMRGFWQEVWDELLGEGRITVPKFPCLSSQQKASLHQYGLMPIYIPAITEEDYPSSFVKPDWGRNIEAPRLDRLPLEGRWVAVETIRKPHFDEEGGYHEDVLMLSMGHMTRFNMSWNELVEERGFCAKIVNRTGFRGISLLSLEEWNLVANLFNWLREYGFLNLPDLGGTNSYEWCQNGCGAERCLKTGRAWDGGLGYVGSEWRTQRGGGVGFRVLAVL